MEMIKKHVDTVIILGGIIGSVLWMNGKFNEIDKRFNNMEKEVSMIRTVLIMRGIMPNELATNE
jgi:hypothetical protein